MLTILILAISILIFTIITIAKSSISSVNRDRVHHLVALKINGATTLDLLHSLPMGPTGSLAITYLGSYSATLVCMVILIIDWMGVNWATIIALTSVIVITMTTIHSISKILASLKGEYIALKCASQVRWLFWVLNPLLAAITKASRTIMLINHDSNDPTNNPTNSSKVDLQLDSAKDPLDDREVKMIRGIVRLDKTVAREIMVPRVDMVAVEIETPISELAEHMIKGGHSRIPIYKDKLDNVEGIAYARDILTYLLRSKESSTLPVKILMRPPLFIPESKTLEDLLKDFQQLRTHMAIVVDEYGGVSGVATIEDLLEEIVGEIEDEFDVLEESIEQINENEFIVDARTSMDEINELLNVTVENDGFDTLGGFVYHQLGKIASFGDKVDYDGLNIEVISTVGRRIKRLRIIREIPNVQ
jgi:putative hemolysin